MNAFVVRWEGQKEALPDILETIARALRDGDEFTDSEGHFISVGQEKPEQGMIMVSVRGVVQVVGAGPL